jgi:hypothetical protein
VEGRWLETWAANERLATLANARYPIYRLTVSVRAFILPLIDPAEKAGADTPVRLSGYILMRSSRSHRLTSEVDR